MVTAALLYALYRADMDAILQTAILLQFVQKS